MCGVGSAPRSASFRSGPTRATIRGQLDTTRHAHAVGLAERTGLHLQVATGAAHWDQCRVAHEAVASGEYTQKQFADEVGVSQGYIPKQTKAWRDYGAIPAGMRPSYSDVMQKARVPEERPEVVARLVQRALVPIVA